MSNKLNKVRHNENDIVIDDGSKVYNIKNKQGKILSQFSFRPTDTNIVDRYEEVQKFFNEFSFPEEMDIKEVENIFTDKMNYLVGSEMGDAFFSIMGPFSPMPGGRIFLEVCLESVIKVIEKEMNVHIKKGQSRVSKYTQKYHG